MPKYKGKVTLTYEFDGIEAESKQDAFLKASDKAYAFLIASDKAGWMGDWDYEIEEENEK